MQDPVRGWDEQLRLAQAAGSPFRLIKSFHPEDYHHANSASPGIFFIYRFWADQHNQGRWIDMAAQSHALGNQAADEYIAMFKDSVNTHMGTVDNGRLFVESLNEEYPTRNPTKLRAIVEFDRAFVRRLKLHCPGVRPVVFTAAVGNPDHNEYGALVDLARETAVAGGAFGYHGYWSVHQRQSFVNSPPHMRDLHMRWVEVDNYLVTRGIRVNWMLGESGCCGAGADGYNPRPLDGWKHNSAWNGDETAYLDDIADMDELLAATRAAREGRLLGAVLFTSGGGSQWRYFEINESILRRLGEYVRTTPTPAPRPPEPPQPPASNVRGIDVSRWQGVMDWQKAKTAGAQFAFIKATEGQSWVDPQYGRNWAEAQKAGIPRGAYHFFRNGFSPENQAQHFVSTVRSGGFGELPLVADIEDTQGTPNAEEVRTFLLQVEMLSGRKPIVYTGAWWWNQFGSLPWAKEYDLWIANYRATPPPVLPAGWDTWVFWQYTSTGPGPVYGAQSNGIDLNYFNGSADDLRRYIGEDTAVPTELVNGSFEGGWYHPDGIPELQIPEGWTFSFETTPPTANPYDSNAWSGYVRPEVRVIPREQLPPAEQGVFIRDGRQCVKIFKGNGAWWGELSQQVHLARGSYRFEAPVFGDLVKAYGEAGKVWANDPQQRDGQYRFRLNGAYTEWLPLTPGRWNEIAYTFSSEGGPVTVGLQIRCNFALQNSGVFVDGWSLSSTAVTPPIDPPVEPPVDPPTIDIPEGKPRVQYGRVYWVVGGHIAADVRAKIYSMASDAQVTVGPSFDDAGIGALASKTAVLWNIAAMEQQEYREWYTEHYPGTLIEFRQHP
jgi:lysozyme